MLQWSYKVWKAQHVLGGLYERIYDIIRSRGVPPAEETVLWACLARLKDPATGEGGAAGGKSIPCYQPGWSFNEDNGCGRRSFLQAAGIVLACSGVFLPPQLLMPIN